MQTIADELECDQLVAEVNEEDDSEIHNGDCLNFSRIDNDCQSEA